MEKKSLMNKTEGKKRSENTIASQNVIVLNWFTTKSRNIFALLFELFPLDFSGRDCSPTANYVLYNY